MAPLGEPSRSDDPVKVHTSRGQREAELHRRAGRIRRRRLIRFAAGIGAAAAAFLAVGLGLGGQMARDASPREWGEALGNFVRARLTAAPVDSLRIDIKFKHLHTIHTKRDAARAEGMLIARRDDFVPGSIALADANIPIRLRLIGPEAKHLERDLWSLEIRVQGDAHVDGMRRFALYAPESINAPLPLLAATQFALADLAAPRTALVEVALNGDELGLAALVELPSPELLQASGRSESPIVGFDASAYWEALRDNDRTGPFDNPYTAPVTLQAAAGDRNAKTAVALLRGFLDERLPASEVFDVPATARWLASAEFWGDPSCVHWTRTRFYLDGLTARLAPIPPLPEHRAAFEGAETRASTGELIATLSELGSRLLADPEIRRHFARELRVLASRLQTTGEGDSLLAELQRDQSAQLPRLQAQAPFTRAVPLAALAARLATLADIDPARDTWFARSLARGDPALPRVVAAYTGNDAEGPFLDLHNLLPVPVAITTLRHADDSGEATPVTLASRISFPIRLAATPAGQPERPVRVRYRQPKAAAVPETIRGVAQIGGDSREHVFTARSAPAPLDAHPVPTSTLDEVLERHPFLRPAPGDLALHTQPGRFEVDGSLVMPPGMALVVAAGTELVFSNRRGLITSGPLDLLGTAEEPVVLRGAEKRRGAVWGGIALLGANRESTWSHTRIVGTTGIDRPGWQLPAGVTIRRAPVTLEAVRIEASRANAALAVIDTELRADALTVIESSGTALLIQGTEARLTDVTIERTGRNGIEAHRADVELRGGSIRTVRASAIEATHSATVTAADLEISEASVAAAAKNGARIVLAQPRVNRITHIPFLAFTDRPELGGGEIRSDGGEVVHPGPPGIAQTGSRVRIDGAETRPVDAAIGDLRID